METSDIKLAEQLIKFVIQHKYFSIKDKYIARGYAQEDLTAIKEQYGWKVMKKAAKHSACTGITQFKNLCQQLKQP